MKYLPMMLSFLICFACNGKPNTNKEKASEEEIADQKPVFEMVTVPNLLTDPQVRAEYAVEHYWDKFDFSDTTFIHSPEVTEQAFSNYIYLMGTIPREKAVSAIHSMLRKAEVEKKMFTYLTDLYEKYLYDPNAPMRNEELYIPVLQFLVETPSLEEVHKIRPAHLLEVALRNRQGEAATNFVYELAGGKKGKLYDVKANHLILYFYNPDCENCREISEAMKKSQQINGLIAEGILKILSVYPDGDEQAWIDHLPEMPKTWINGQDKEVLLKNEEIYDLKAIPCLYLLDKEKKVVLKDATFEQIEAYLYRTY